MAANTMATKTTATNTAAINTTTDIAAPSPRDPRASLATLPQELKDQIFTLLALSPSLAPSRCSNRRSTLHPLASWANFALVSRACHLSATRWLHDTHELVLVKIRWPLLAAYLTDCWMEDMVLDSGKEQALAFAGRGGVGMTVEVVGPGEEEESDMVGFLAEAKKMRRFWAVLRLVAGMIVTDGCSDLAGLALCDRDRAPRLRLAVRLHHTSWRPMTAQRQHDLLRPLQSIVAEETDFSVEGDVCDRAHADAMTRMMRSGVSSMYDSIRSPVARLWDYVDTLSKCKDMVDEDIANGRERAALTWTNRITGWDHVSFIAYEDALWTWDQPSQNVLAALTLLEYDLTRTCTFLHLRLKLRPCRLSDPAMFSLRDQAPAARYIGGGYTALSGVYPQLAFELRMQGSHMMLLYRDFDRLGSRKRRRKGGGSAWTVQGTFGPNRAREFHQWAATKPHAGFDVEYLDSEKHWPALHKSSVFNLEPMRFDLHKQVLPEQGRYRRWWDSEMLLKRGWVLESIGDGIEYPVKHDEALGTLELAASVGSTTSSVQERSPIGRTEACEVIDAVGVESLVDGAAPTPPVHDLTTRLPARSYQTKAAAVCSIPGSSAQAATACGP